MKLTGIDVFDSTVERTSAWLQDLMRELNWTDRRRSLLAFRLVLHDLRDHLPAEEAIRFGNQLPMLIRGLYYEDWTQEGKPLPWRSREDLLVQIEDGQTIVPGVFRLLERKFVEGEIDDIHSLLPPDIQELWPEPTRRAA